MRNRVWLLALLLGCAKDYDREFVQNMHKLPEGTEITIRQPTKTDMEAYRRGIFKMQDIAPELIIGYDLVQHPEHITLVRALNCDSLCRAVMSEWLIFVRSHTVPVRYLDACIIVQVGSLKLDDVFRDIYKLSADGVIINRKSEVLTAIESSP
jgi:hypothetical protein